MNQKKDDTSITENASLENTPQKSDAVEGVSSEKLEKSTTIPEEKSAPIHKKESVDGSLNIEPEITPRLKHETPTSKLAILAILLVLLLGALVGFCIDKYLKEQGLEQEKVQTVVEKQALLLSNVTLQLSKQQQLNESLNQSLAKTVTEQLTAQRQTQSILNQKIAELSGRRPNDWLLAEANYLVTMAGRKLWQEKDQKTAAALLITADQRISEMHDESLISLRQALAKDIAALSALPQDKTQDIALALDGLIAQIDNLKLNTVTLPNAVNEPKQVELADDNWRNNLQNTWYAFIDGFIKIRKREGDIVPLMSAKQQWYLEENLKNKLVQAQLAVYRKQQTAFTSSIAISRQWVLQFFDRQDSATTFMLTELDKLQQLTIEVNYPRDLLSRNRVNDELIRRNINTAHTLEQ